MKNKQGPGFLQSTHMAMGIVQSVLGLFAAGSLLFGAHKLVLWYYSREWMGVQFAGVNDCMGEDRIANGDLFEGKTFCNQPENLFPWYVIYERHWLAILGYYATIAAGLILIGWLWRLSQRRAAPIDPTRQQPHGRSSEGNTI